MQRIHLPNTQFSDVLEISEKWLYHQLTRVLRARVWQEVIFFDGENTEDHLYSMIHIDKKSVSFKKKEVIFKESEGEICLILYQASPNKLSKFEYIVQKCSEIGYKKIIFFESERSQKLVLSENKKERLKKIAIEAIEQCWGNVIPEIEYVDSFLWEGSQFKKEPSIVCHTQEEDSIRLADIRLWESISIVVWPEWGFSSKEVEEFQTQKIYFWNRILRCETVGEVVWFYISQKKES